MSTTQYDPVNNVLKIVRDDKSNPPQYGVNLSTQNPTTTDGVSPEAKKQKLRGFILSFVETQEAFDQYQKTNQEDQHRLMPVMSENQENAIAFVRSKGFFPIRIYTYEYILLQKRLIEEVAQNNNLEIEVQDIFNQQT